MAAVADDYRRYIRLEELFPVSTFCFVVCNNLEPRYETRVVKRRCPALFYILNGAIEMEEAGKTVILKTGDFLFVDMGSSQVYRNISPGNTYINAIGFSFSGPEISVSDLDIPVRGNFVRAPIVSDLFQKLHHCWIGQEPGYRLKVLALFFSILHYISISDREETKIPSEYHRLQNVVRYIYDNCFSSNITIEDLCCQCSCSSAYLRKLFAEYFQMSPTKYIRHIKLEFAKNLLVLSNKTISQIAEESGYKDIVRFDRVFKKETGVRPLEYRRMNFVNDVTEN